MGMAKLQIWFTAEGSPCTISERHEDPQHSHGGTLPWEVAIMHCNGKVLNWCHRRYVGIKAPCGYVEIEVPPGCYVIRGGESMGVNAHGGVTGNHMTDHAVVTACCDESTCVTLFAPSLHSCVHGVVVAVRDAIAFNKIPAELGKPVLTALKALSERLPKSDFDDEAIPVMEELLRGLDNPKKGNDDPKSK